MNLKDNHELQENNKARITGIISTPFVFDHETFREGFYTVNVEVSRISGVKDVVPVMVSDRLLDMTQDYCGREIRISGQFRSHSKYNGVFNKRTLFLFARKLSLDSDAELTQGENEVSLDGYICNPPKYRQTPNGREIADILLKVSRPYGKSDYIPCICWGRNAIYASHLNIDTRISVKGRIQSRIFRKTIDGVHTERMMWELSITKMEEVEEKGVVADEQSRTEEAET